jgi:hypothetical protein
MCLQQPDFRNATAYKECISVRRYKPDILVLLALILGIAAAVTTYSQERLSKNVEYYSIPLQ